jgi:hypothetical protein
VTIALDILRSFAFEAKDCVGLRAGRENAH